MELTEILKLAPILAIPLLSNVNVSLAESNSVVRHIEVVEPSAAPGNLAHGSAGYRELVESSQKSAAATVDGGAGKKVNPICERQWLSKVDQNNVESIEVTNFKVGPTRCKSERSAVFANEQWITRCETPASADCKFFLKAESAAPSQNIPANYQPNPDSQAFIAD